MASGLFYAIEKVDGFQFGFQAGVFGFGEGGQRQAARTAVHAHEAHDGLAAADSAAVADNHLDDLHRVLLQFGRSRDVPGAEGVEQAVVDLRGIVVGAAHGGRGESPQSRISS